ncbi:MAG: PQQ-binding-like beta-propeller repeat protein [Streptosporangiales bacterium]|nr:PQQ-binding-like beta-propeller repeat protein [Streptosporangiales bacterium]
MPRRRVVLAAAAALVVAAAAGVSAVVLWPDYGERIRSGRGPYPEAVGGGSPVHPSRVVARGDTDVVVDGLRVVVGNTARTSDTVTAYDLRSGERFWSYARPDVQVREVQETGGALYVRWADGLLAAFDPRAAEVVWHRMLADGAGEMGLRLAGDVVLVVRSGEARAFAAATGEEKWAADLPRGCRSGADARHDARAGHILVLRMSCGAVALDTRRGAVRWGPWGAGRTAVVPVDDERVALARGDGTAVLHSAARGERLGSVRAPAGTFVAGTRDTLVSYDGGVGTRSVVLAGWDLAADELAWTIRRGRGGSWSGAYLAGDLLYTVRTTTATQRRLLVYDAATGQERSRTDIDLTEYLDVPRYAYDDTEVSVADVSYGTVDLDVDTGRGLLFPSGDDLLLAAS